MTQERKDSMHEGIIRKGGTDEEEEEEEEGDRRRRSKLYIVGTHND